MDGETDLAVLLQTMNPQLQDGEFVFTTIPAGQPAPSDLAPLCRFQEQEGTTLILLREEAERAGLAYAFPCRQITLAVHSSLEAVGLLAAVTARLADHGISVNVVSAAFHDHLFVPVDRAAEALAVLRSFNADRKQEADRTKNPCCR